METVGGMPTLWCPFFRPRPFQQASTGRINEAHPWRDMHHLFDCLSQANRVEDAHHLVIEMHRTGQVVGCLFAFQHQRRNATLAEQIGQRCPGRPVTYDSDISLAVDSTVAKLGTHGSSLRCVGFPCGWLAQQ